MKEVIRRSPSAAQMAMARTSPQKMQALADGREPCKGLSQGGLTMNPLDRARALFYKNIEAMKTATPAIQAELERENQKLGEEISRLANEAEFQARNEGNSNNASPSFSPPASPGD